VYVVHRHGGRVRAVQYVAREQAGETAHLAIVGTEIEQRSAFHIGWNHGENRDASFPGGRDYRIDRGDHSHVAADPDGLDAARDQGCGRFAHAGGAVHRGLREGDAHFGADLASEGDLGDRIGFSAVVDHSHRFERGIDRSRHFEGLPDWLHRAMSCEPIGMIVGAGNADSGRDGIGDNAEDMVNAGRFIRIGHRLERWCADGNQKVVASVRHLAPDRLGDGHVSLGIEAFRYEVFAFQPATLSQPGEDPFAALVEDCLGRVLEHGDLPRIARSRMGSVHARAQIGQEQQRGRACDKE